MKLAQHLQQGELQYLLIKPINLSVYENSNYRWLQMNNTVQSIMLKRKPWYLPLTHQYYLLLPLIFIKPTSFVEFGLGGGNNIRLINKLYPECDILSVETNPEVVSIFHQYFDPDNIHLNVTVDSVTSWLNKQIRLKESWYVLDIFQEKNNESYDAPMIESFIAMLSENSWLSINATMSSDASFASLLNTIKQQVKHHKVKWFTIPNYQNKVIHLFPNSLQMGLLVNFPYTTWGLRGEKLWLAGR